LYKRYDCRLQSSGSDQWGNVVSGIDLGRRTQNVQLFGLTTPLITTSSGSKMGKTAAGAVWLNKDMLSVYDYWQFWRNTEDGDVGRFLRIFTDMPLAEIARLESLQGAELNDAKKILATEATALLHGRDAANGASETARRTFEERISSQGLPLVDMDWSDSGRFEQRSAEAIMKASGLASSLSDAKRKIAESAVKINSQSVSDPSALYSMSDVDPQAGAFIVQYGKKKIILVKPV
jgi:tyrosyl-tRNA synthetase